MTPCPPPTGFPPRRRRYPGGRHARCRWCSPSGSLLERRPRARKRVDGESHPRPAGGSPDYVDCVDATSQIAIIEKDLRRLVQAVLGDGTAEWLNGYVSEESYEALQARRTEEAKRRAPAAVPQSLLAYTHFYELRRILEKNWDTFAPALGPKKDFGVLADRVEDFRNAPAHSRELLPHEIAMLQGIAGTFRTQVTAFLSSQAPDGKHYPVIESARDSFGNELDVERQSHQSAQVPTNLRLQLGDVVEFALRGWDPQGRELTWMLRIWPHAPGSLARRHIATGTEVTLTWEVLPEHVSAATFVEIDVKSSGPYHRHQGYDSRVVFGYVVDPPDPD